MNHTDVPNSNLKHFITHTQSSITKIILSKSIIHSESSAIDTPILLYRTFGTHPSQFVSIPSEWLPSAIDSISSPLSTNGNNSNPLSARTYSEDWWGAEFGARGHNGDRKWGPFPAVEVIVSATSNGKESHLYLARLRFVVSAVVRRV